MLLLEGWDRGCRRGTPETRRRIGPPRFPRLWKVHDCTLWSAVKTAQANLATLHHGHTHTHAHAPAPWFPRLNQGHTRTAGHKMKPIMLAAILHNMQRHKAPVFPVLPRASSSRQVHEQESGAEHQGTPPHADTSLLPPRAARRAPIPQAGAGPKRGAESGPTYGAKRAHADSWRAPLGPWNWGRKSDPKTNREIIHLSDVAGPERNNASVLL